MELEVQFASVAALVGALTSAVVTGFACTYPLKIVGRTELVSTLGVGGEQMVAMK